MVPLTRRQRLVLIVLGLANLIALSTVGLLLLRAPTASDVARLSSSPDPNQPQACRQAISRALFDAGQSGMVHTQDDGTILIQFDRAAISGDLRLEADAATWAALEAVAGQADCLAFSTVQVTVVFSSPARGADLASSQGLRATARVGIADLMLWSLGGIDDAELTLRLDYQPPAPLPTAFLTATAIP